VTIHHNLFLNKAIGISFRMPVRLGPMEAYCNTFVNCGSGRGEVGDVGDWINTGAVLRNNVFYHARPDQCFYDVQTKPWDKLDSDYNLFYSTTGDTAWRHLYRRRATALHAWQQYSGRDEHSVWKDPGFANPNGSRPEDFRRGKPSEIVDVPGSRYGEVCGAYTSEEAVVGILSEGSRRSAGSK
jgi:hypothetical protein